MSNILNTTAAIIVLRLATMGSDQAPAANYHAWSRPNDAVLGKSRSGYGGPASLHEYYYARPATTKAGHANHAATTSYRMPCTYIAGAEYGRGVAGLACDMPSSTC